MGKAGECRKKKGVMIKKRNLKRRKERIGDDWTWKERRMRWKLEQVAIKEAKRGKEAIRYGKIRIDGEW